MTASVLESVLTLNDTDAKELAHEAGQYLEKGASDVSTLSYLLRGWRDRVISGRAIRRAGKDRTGKALWSLSVATAEDAEDAYTPHEKTGKSKVNSRSSASSAGAFGARSQGGNSFGNSRAPVRRVPVDTEKVAARIAAKKVGR